MKLFAMAIGLVLMTFSQARCAMINYDFSLKVSTISAPSFEFDLNINDSISGNFCFDKDIFSDDMTGGDSAAPYGFTGQVHINHFDNYLHTFTITQNQQLTSLSFYDGMDYLLYISFIDNTFEFFSSYFNYSGLIDQLNVVSPIIEPHASTPEPSTIILLTIGLSAYAGYKKKFGSNIG